jgi:flavin-dependent dehydrogenase
LRASWLVAADGLHSPLRRRWGLDQATRGRPRFGLRRHFAVPPWSDVVEVHWSPRAEAYVTPVSSDLVGVAVLCCGGAPYDVWLGEFPELRARLEGAAPVTPVLGAGPLRQRSAARRYGRAFLVGDAAGYVDALTGEGIAVGLAGGEALVRCLLAGRPEAYDLEWRRSSRRYRAITSGLLWARERPALRSMIVPAASRMPLIFKGIVDLLA